MGYVFNNKDSQEYDQWFKNPDNRLFSNLEKKTHDRDAEASKEGNSS
jgi:hypothetical protein